MMRFSQQELFGGRTVPFVVRGLNVCHPSERVAIDGLMVSFVTAGWVKLRSANGVMPLGPGSILTIPAGVPCAAEPVGVIEAVAVYLAPRFVELNLEWLPHLHPLADHLRHAVSGHAQPTAFRVAEPEMMMLRPLLNTLIVTTGTDGLEYAAYALAAGLCRSIGHAVSHADPEELVMPSALPRPEVVAAASLLREQIARPWTVKDLSAEVLLSESQLSRLFRRDLGMSPAAFMWKSRTDALADLLAIPSMTVNEASRRTGWASQSAASRAFRRRYGMSPREFVSMARAPLTELQEQEALGTEREHLLA